MTPDERMAELEGVVAQQHAVIAQQREQITALLAEIQDLPGQLAKDSHNSHKPLTNGRLQRRPRSQRRPSGRKSGGQLGHAGQTLPLAATPDEVVTHQPAQCQHSQTALEAVAPHAVELPPVRLQVRLQARKHRVAYVHWPRLRASDRGGLPRRGAQSDPVWPTPACAWWHIWWSSNSCRMPARDLLADLFGHSLSVGTLVTIVQQCVQTLAPVEKAFKAERWRSGAVEW